MEISLSLSLTGRLLSSSPATALFSVPGSRGFFYDFSDYTTQFADTAGTTAITGVGQSLGLVLDKSAGLALGPELVTNGDFSGGSTGWTDASTAPSTVSVVDGSLQLVSDGATRARARSSQTTVVGRTYRVTFIVLSGTVEFNCGTTVAGTEYFGGGTFSVGTHTRLVLATSTTMHLQIHKGVAGTGVADNISVRELPGNHATQATAGSRALTQVRPMFTQRNRAVGSELPENNVYWQASSTVNGITVARVASGIDTDGLPYADYSVSGTASANTFQSLTVAQPMRTPALSGQTWACSFIFRLVGGTAPPASCGPRAEIYGETAPSTQTEGFFFAAQQPTAEDQTQTLTGTFVNAATNQARGNLIIRTENGATVNYTVRIKGLMFELGSTRTTYQPAVSGELRNRAIGSGNPASATDWLSSSTSNGITATRVAFGFDADGLPYNDWLVTGTASAGSSVQIYAGPSGRTPAATGQTWTASARVQIISGTAPPATNGVRVSLDGETAPSTFTEFGGGPTLAPTTETLAATIYTLANAATNQARPLIAFVTQSGVTVDYTVRVKAFQFEQNATYSRYQRTITANEWYEPGFTSYRGIRFDGSDDFLQTAAIDFAGAESLGTELVTNGDFATGNLTGWVELHSAPSTVSVVSGVATWSTDGVNSGRIRQSFVTTVGRAYKVSCSGAGVSVAIGTTAGGTEVVGFGTNNARPTFTFVATSTLTWFNTATATNGATLDNVSVREVLIAADKMTVVAGVRKLSDAARGMVAELGNATAGAFRLEAPNSTGVGNYLFTSGGSLTGAGIAAVNGFAAPDTGVLTGIGDISADTAILRRNGSQVATSAADQGTGNYGNDIVYIGRRGGSSLPFNGVLTFLCVINRTLTASELAQLEAFANSRTGAY